MDKKMISRKDRQKAKRLKSVRDRQHLTQEKMAERLDISYSTYQRMESGRNNITIEHLEKLHKEFGVSSDYILFGTVNDEKHYELELEYMNDETYIYANMDNKVFKEKIAKTSCGWRGKNVIRRNAIIKMHNENYDIEEFKGESPYINNYIEMLKEKEK